LRGKSNGPQTIIADPCGVIAKAQTDSMTKFYFVRIYG